MFKKLFGKNRHEDAARALYGQVVSQSRKPVFYTDHGVADTIDGRFDLVALHCWMVMFRLKDESEVTGELSQMLFDVMFENMDIALREMGVSDVSVGKKVKKMASAFLGRAVAYETAWLEMETAENMKESLKRNLFRDTKPTEDHLMSIGVYIKACLASLKTQTIAELMEGHVSFSEAGSGTGPATGKVKS